MVSATLPCLQTKWFNLLWKFTYHFTPSKLQILEYNRLVSCVQSKNVVVRCWVLKDFSCI
jgi:hypothetical protein